MPIVNIKGVGQAQFPDGMSVDDIRAFLRNKYYQQSIDGQSDILQPTTSTAAPYNPSLVERASQGIAGALKDTGLISDNYRAQQIGKNLTTLGEFLPGVGDVADADAAGRALAKGNYGEAAISSIGLIPGFGEFGQAIFGGILAKNADLGMLKKAKNLEDTGADRNEIWKETGWANDKGDWKFEIDDSQMKINLEGFTENKRPFTDIVEKRALLSNPIATEKAFTGDVVTPNYSDLSTMNVSIKELGSAKGIHDPSSFGINLSDKLEKGELDSVAMHELQHAIQQQENFARGGSPTGELLDDDRIQALTNKITSLESSGDYDYNTMRGLLAEKSLLITNADDPFKQYQRLAGEAEARNVQTRLDMTPEQRRATPPWETLDVPESELIYRK